MSILEELKKKWDGKTQLTIEAESHIPQYTISRILSGKPLGVKTARRIRKAYPDLAFQLADCLMPQEDAKAHKPSSDN